MTCLDCYGNDIGLSMKVTVLSACLTWFRRVINFESLVKAMGRPFSKSWVPGSGFGAPIEHSSCLTVVMIVFLYSFLSHLVNRIFLFFAF